MFVSGIYGIHSIPFPNTPLGVADAQAISSLFARRPSGWIRRLYHDLEYRSGVGNDLSACCG